MIQPTPLFKSYRFYFIVLAAIIGILMPVLSFDFGVTCDEHIHNTHGKVVLDYFTGVSEKAILDPFPEEGNVYNIITPDYNIPIEDDPDFKSMNATGGFFDLVCNAVHRYIGLFGEYENRHFINALFGALLFILIGLFAKEFGGWRAGVLALLFTVLSPRLFAHSMNNPKDIPFALFYLFSVYQMILLLKELPTIKIKRAILLVLSISLAINLRFAGVVLLGYLFLFWAIHWVAENGFRLPTVAGWKKMAIQLGYLICITVASYLAIALFWPFAQQDIFAPIKIIKELTHFSQFNSYNLFEGRWINNWEIPWNYLPKWIWITIPLFIAAGALLVPLYFAILFFKNHLANFKYLLILSFSSFFPIFYAIYQESNVYDEARHFIFVIPPFIILTTIAWLYFIDLVKLVKVKIAVLALLGLMLLEPFLFMVRNHPQEAFYFSPLIGGVDGAFKKYETDYWGHSLRAAVEWIVENEKPESIDKPVRVRVWYGDRMSSEYYLMKQPGYKFVYALENTADWDYSILLTAAAKHNAQWLYNWPPPYTVHQVMVDHTPLCAIIKNPLTK
jgi:hypothetical protein